jgi:hypothetical protein
MDILYVLLKFQKPVTKEIGTYIKRELTGNEAYHIHRSAINISIQIIHNRSQLVEHKSGIGT